MRFPGLLLAVVLTSPAWMVGCGGEATAPQESSPADAREDHTRLRLRLKEDGTYALTHAAGERATERPLATGRLDGAVADTRVVLAGLETALANVTADPRTRQIDGYSDVRLEFEADPLVPWKRVQWVLLTVAHPRVGIWKVRFRSEERAPPMSIDLPKDRSCCPGLHAIRLELRVKLTRAHGTSDEHPFTRVRLSTAYVEYDEGYMCPAFDPSETHETPIGVVDLPPDAASAEDRRQAWLRIERALRERILPGDRPLGILRAPPPSGGGVPYRDAVVAMLLLRRLGAEPVQLEGAYASLVEEGR